MKNYLKRYTYALLLSVATLNACDDPDDLVTKNAKEGGLVVPVRESVNYVINNTTDIKLDLEVLQGPKISSVDVYKKFYSVASDAWTNEVLVKTIDVGENETVTKSFTENYASLITGLQLQGAALPATETELGIGDFWEFRFVSKLQNGNVFESSKKQQVSISTRFAGTYLGSGTFIHPVNGPRTFEDLKKSISSISATGYRGDKTGDLGTYPFTFEIDADGKIKVTGGDVTGSPISGTGRVGLDEVNGVDTLYINYQYTGGTGVRAINEVFIKQVE